MPPRVSSQVSGVNAGRGKRSEPNTDLLQASQAAVLVKKYFPSFANILLGYPAATSPDPQERLSWTSYAINDEATYVLTHRFSMSEDDAYVAVERQFYVSRSYSLPH